MEIFNSRNKDFSLFHLFLLFQSGCISVSEVSLPDALPPDAYVNEPIAAKNDNENIQQTEENDKLLVKKNEVIFPENENNFSIEFKKDKTQDTDSEYQYKLKAMRELSVWIQDEKGNEIVWKRLSRNEEFLVKVSGPLTLTCSATNALIIYDNKDRTIRNIDPRSNSNKRIDIIRLP